MAISNLQREARHTTRQLIPSPTYYNDTALVEKVANCTTKVSTPPPPQLIPICPPAPCPPPPALPKQPPWATVTSKKLNNPCTTPLTTNNLALRATENRTLLITRDCTSIPDTVTPLILRNAINNALPKAHIAEVRYTTKRHVHLSANATTTSDTPLKPKTQLAKAIRAIVTTPTGIQKEVRVVLVVIHNIPITTSSTKEGHNQFLQEVETYNPVITINCLPR